MANTKNISQFRKSFGKTIRKYREKAEISQEVFAEKADIHRTYVSSIELGKVDVGIGVAYKLSKALNVDLAEIIKESLK